MDSTKGKSSKPSPVVFVDNSHLEESSNSNKLDSREKFRKLPHPLS